MPTKPEVSYRSARTARIRGQKPSGWPTPLTQEQDTFTPLCVPGRIANFINGELWGRVSGVSWAVVFPQSADFGTPVEMIAPRHPSQVYAAVLEGALLLAYSQWRFWRTGATRKPGTLSGEFLILYAVVRIIGEQFREPDASLILGMSRGVFYSLFMVVAGATIMALSHRTSAVKGK